MAGAGSAGVCAAIAAAREGASVLLIERSGVPGGMNTSALVGPLMTFHAGETQVVRGLAQNIVDRLVKLGGSLGHVRDPIGFTATITPIDAALLKQVYFHMISEYKITLLLHTHIFGVKKDGNRITSVQCINKSGIREYEAKVFIDATGDADIAAQSGARFEYGREQDGLTQPMSLIFKIGGINFDKIKEYVYKNPDKFMYEKSVGLEKYVAVSGYYDEIISAKHNHDFSIENNRILIFQGVKPTEATVNMTRVPKKHATSAEDVSEATIIAYRQVDELISFFKKYIPGLENCFLAESGDCIGIRESRRIIGDYILTAEDILSYREFPDSVACCAYPIDIHNPAGDDTHFVRMNHESYYDVPYRIMLPQDIQNLLVTGRCVSATHEACASVRISATAMTLGEAAGCAAAIANTTSDGNVREIDIARLQQALIQHGAIVGRRFLEATVEHGRKGESA